MTADAVIWPFWYDSFVARCMSREEDLAQVRAAFASGRTVGLQPDCSENACPFSAEDGPIRSAWLDGMMIGRIEASLNGRRAGQTIEQDPTLSH
jgi:hypothetical protein